jgi:hypothetical protein
MRRILKRITVGAVSIAPDGGCLCSNLKQDAPPNDNRQFQDRHQLTEHATEILCLQIGLAEESEKRMIAKGSSIIVEAGTIYIKGVTSHDHRANRRRDSEAEAERKNRTLQMARLHGGG